MCTEDEGDRENLARGSKKNHPKVILRELHPLSCAFASRVHQRWPHARPHEGEA